MKLDAWLRKGPSTAERLTMIASLCGAIADSHQRGVVLGGLGPDGIDVGNDGIARIESGGLRPGAPYAAPELAQEGSPSAKADIYSAAAIIYEVLAGKPPFESDPPRPLQEARPDLSQDLTDAVSACLEHDPEWRPADLSYLRAVVQQLQKDAPAPVRAQASRAAAPRATGPPPMFLDPTPRKRHDDRSALTRALPVILVVVAIAGTGAAWLWFDVLRPGRSGTAGTRMAPSPSTAPSATEAESNNAPALGQSGEPLAPTPAPSSGAPLPTSRPSGPSGSPGNSSSPSPAGTLRPSARPPSAAAPTAPPTTLAASVPERNPSTSTGATPPVAEPEPTPGATEAPPLGPALLRAVAPFRLRAGALQVLDVHGSGLRADHRAKIVPLHKAEPVAGFMVTRYQVRGPELLLVFVQVDASVKAGKYALSLVDASGAETNAFTIEVVGK